MKYNETNYHGTKKQLREYLQSVKRQAFKNIEDEYRPLFKKCVQELYDKYGITEFCEKSAKIIDKELLKLADILDNLGEDDVYAYNSGIIHLTRSSKGVAQSVKDNINISIHPNYALISSKFRDAKSELNTAWQPVEYGILGKHAKVKYICRDLEEVGFDLTPYYNEMKKLADVSVPVVNVNYNKLGIK